MKRAKIALRWAWLLGGVRPELAALRAYKESGSTGNPSFQELMNLAESGDMLAIKALDNIGHAIGRGMRMIVAVLAPEQIVVVGECTRLWSRVGPIIETEVVASVLAGKPPLVRPAAADPSTARLCGTVALVLQKHFGPGMVARAQISSIQSTAARIQ